MIFSLNLRCNKTKSHGTIWSDDLLAYRLLKSANLTTRDGKLIKATIGELKDDTLKIKLTKIFSYKMCCMPQHKSLGPKLPRRRKQKYICSK